MRQREEEEDEKLKESNSKQRRRKMFLIRGAEIMASEVSQKNFTN